MASDGYVHDAFLTHDWGEDGSNHRKVKAIYDMLKEHGVNSWFDEEKMESNIKVQMTNGINESRCVVVFITTRYIKKVASESMHDNCFFEFNHACNKRADAMIPVIVEAAAKKRNVWRGLVESQLGGLLYLDMSEDVSKLAPVVRELAEKIKALRPGPPGEPPPPQPVAPSPGAVVISAEADAFLRGSADFDDALLEKLRGLGVTALRDLLEDAEEGDLVEAGIPKIKARRCLREVKIFFESPLPPVAVSGEPPDKCLRTLEGHTSYVYAVALSADGRLLCTGSDDKTAKVWDASSGECLRTLEGHTSSVLAVALSADGRLLCTGSKDKTAKVWDASSGECLRTLEGHTDYVFAVALSADGRLLCTGSADKTAKVWDTSSGECLRTLEGHTNPVYAVALSADGRLLCTGSSDKTAKVWDASSGECLRTLEGHTHYVFAVALSADGRLLCTGSHDNTAKVWDASSGECLRTLKGHTNFVVAVALSADGRLLCTGSKDRTAKVWDASSGECLRTLKGHTNSVLAVALSADGRLLCTGSGDNTAKVWGRS